MFLCTCTFALLVVEGDTTRYRPKNPEAVWPAGFFVARLLAEGRAA
jgi:hypothetical protein